MKKYHVGVDLQNLELNLVLRKHAMIVRNYLHRIAVLLKVLSQSKFILQVMFHINRDFNNLARLKNKFSKSSYKVRQTESCAEKNFDNCQTGIKRLEEGRFRKKCCSNF